MVVLGGGAVPYERGVPVATPPWSEKALDSNSSQIQLTQLQGEAANFRNRNRVSYRGTSPIRNRPPPEDPPGTLGIGLR